MKKTLVISMGIIALMVWHLSSTQDEVVDTLDSDEEYLDSSADTTQVAQAGQKSANQKNAQYLKKKNVKDLDRLGEVFNEFNTTLSKEEIKQIKEDKAKYDLKEKLKNKSLELEKAYLAKNYSINEIKKIQSDVIDLKRKLNEEVENIEKWDPKFVYYLIINDNYTLSEINQMKNLSEHGLSQDEISYIKEYTQTSEFNERLGSFKENNEVVRKTASVPKEKDEYIDEPERETASLEDKLIEMDYNSEEKEEMAYGYNQ